jgi:hypothetical protein
MQAAAHIDGAGPQLSRHSGRKTAPQPMPGRSAAFTALPARDPLVEGETTPTSLLAPCLLPGYPGAQSTIRQTAWNARDEGRAKPFASLAGWLARAQASQAALAFGEPFTFGRDLRLGRKPTGLRQPSVPAQASLHPVLNCAPLRRPHPRRAAAAQPRVPGPSSSLGPPCKAGNKARASHTDVGGSRQRLAACQSVELPAASPTATDNGRAPLRRTEPFDNPVCRQRSTYDRWAPRPGPTASRGLGQPCARGAEPRPARGQGHGPGAARVGRAVPAGLVRNGPSTAAVCGVWRRGGGCGGAARLG